MSFTEESLVQLKELEKHYLYYKSFEEMKEVIQQVLSADVSKRSEIRVSEFEFDCLSIFFTATESCISIQRIALTSDFKKEKQQQLENLLLFVCFKK